MWLVRTTLEQHNLDKSAQKLIELIVEYADAIERKKPYPGNKLDDSAPTIMGDVYDLIDTRSERRQLTEPIVECT